MAVIIRLAPPGELLLKPDAKEKLSRAEQKERAVEPSAIGEPEQRLWKLSAPAARPRYAIIELVVFLLLLTLALAAIIECFTELSGLLRNNAIEHVAARG
jgi:hypothetical protein